MIPRSAHYEQENNYFVNLMITYIAEDINSLVLLQSKIKYSIFNKKSDNSDYVAFLLETNKDNNEQL